MKKLWIVTNYIGISDVGTVFDIMGIFSSKEKAKAACTREEEGFGPLILDEIAPKKIMTWADFEYPWRPNKKKCHVCKEVLLNQALDICPKCESGR